MTEEIKIRPENLPPLAKDLVSVVAAYKRLKGLGPSWEAKHMARALVNAGELITSVGYHGGQLERAVGLLEWLKESGRDFNLETASTFFKAYEAHLAAKNNSERSRCETCGEQYWGTGRDCGRH